MAHFITCSCWTIQPLCLPSCLYLYIYVVGVCLCPHREGIQWEAIDWMDNAECLDLIEKVTDSQTLTKHSHHRDRPLTANQSTLTQTPHCAYIVVHLLLYHYIVSF